MRLGDQLSQGEIDKAIMVEHLGTPVRSLGHDGFTNKFYKFYLKNFKAALIQLFQPLHNKTIDLSGLNLAFITLLPKCDNPQKVTDYRHVLLQHSIPKNDRQGSV